MSKEEFEITVQTIDENGEIEYLSLDQLLERFSSVMVTAGNFSLVLREDVDTLISFTQDINKSLSEAHRAIYKFQTEVAKLKTRKNE